MNKSCIIGILLCMVMAIGSAGCNDTNPSARAASQYHPVVIGVIELLEAGIEEEIILTYIEKQGLPEDITANELVAMKATGASETILTAMLGNQSHTGSSDFPFNLTDNLEVGAPITHRALAVYPVYLTQTPDFMEFLTLDEAQNRDVIIITEKEGGSVPCVIIENTGQTPVYICAGEVIFGGKQDRMIAHDIIISPGASVEVKVRCVESGRWHGASSQFLSSGFMGSTKLRDAVQFMDQSVVWASVAEQNAHIEAETSTGTYRAALTHEQVQELYEEFSQAVLNQLNGDNLVGMIVASNGKILCVDIFGSPALFESLKEKILKASVLDIIGIEDEDIPPPGKHQILDFYNDAVSTDFEELMDYRDNTNNKRENSNVTVNESVDKDNPGQVYHQNIIQKHSGAEQFRQEIQNQSEWQGSSILRQQTLR